MLNKLYRDDCGLIVSAEIVLVLSIGVLAMVVGLHGVAKAVVTELNDFSSAIGTVDQSFVYNGLAKVNGGNCSGGGGICSSGFGGVHASVRGAGYFDSRDECDCSPIIQPRPRIKIDAFGLGGEAGGFGYFRGGYGGYGYRGGSSDCDWSLQRQNYRGDCAALGTPVLPGDNQPVPNGHDK